MVVECAAQGGDVLGGGGAVGEGDGEASFGEGAAVAGGDNPEALGCRFGSDVESLASEQRDHEGLNGGGGEAEDGLGEGGERKFSGFFRQLLDLTFNFENTGDKRGFSQGPGAILSAEAGALMGGGAVEVVGEEGGVEEADGGRGGVAEGAVAEGFVGLLEGAHGGIGDIFGGCLDGFGGFWSGFWGSDHRFGFRRG